MFFLDVDDWAVERKLLMHFLLLDFVVLHAWETEHLILGNELKVSASDKRECSRPPYIFNESGFDDARYSESFQPPSREFENMVKKLPKPCGVFAVHDPLGRFLRGTCSALGIEIPHEVAVIGANDDPLVCNLTYPTLSSDLNSLGCTGRKTWSGHGGIIKKSTN